MVKTFKNKIDQAFIGQNALICYAPLGDPLFPDEMIDIYVECGVNIIEIGLPNDNPYEDGVVIGSSMERVRNRGLTTEDIHHHTLSIDRSHPDLAKVWMCYEDADLSQFEAHSAENNIDGLLMVGMGKRDDISELRAIAARNHVHTIPFAAYKKKGFNAGDAKHFQGFVFLKAVDGVTGARSDDMDSTLPDKITRLKDMGVTIPIVAGFGISTPDQVRQALKMGANGVVTGSATVSAALAGKESLRRYLMSMRQALDE